MEKTSAPFNGSTRSVTSRAGATRTPSSPIPGAIAPPSGNDASSVPARRRSVRHKSAAGTEIPGDEPREPILDHGRPGMAGTPPRAVPGGRFRGVRLHLSPSRPAPPHPARCATWSISIPAVTRSNAPDVARSARQNAKPSSACSRAKRAPARPGHGPPSMRSTPSTRSPRTRSARDVEAHERSRTGHQHAHRRRGEGCRAPRSRLTALMSSTYAFRAQRHDRMGRRDDRQ